MFKYKRGQMVIVVGHIPPTSYDRYYVGKIGTILHPYLDRRGRIRYELDIRSVYRPLLNICPLESLIRPINPPPPPPNKTTSWEEFVEKTGIDPREEPVYV